MIEIKLAELVGDFAEDKDMAGKLRREIILPALSDGKAIRIDFTGVSLATQSFIHALIAEALRRYGEGVLARIEFKKCDEVVRGIIKTVVQYVLETVEST
jgi:hypothetical protein